MRWREQGHAPLILLVDSDDDFRLGLAETLRDDGCVVHEFARPAQMPPLETLPPLDLAIADNSLPGELGILLADELHAARPELPILILSAGWSASLETAVHRRAHCRLLSKPFDYDQLSNTISQYLPPATATGQPSRR